MRATNAVGRFVASPIGAAVICLGGCALWFGLTQPCGNAEKPNAPGKQRGGAARIVGRQRAGEAGRNAVVSRDEVSRESPREDTTMPSDADSEAPKATESATMPAEAGDADRPERQASASGGQPADARAPGAIGTHDPRAAALAEYTTKKAAVADDAATQKQLAIWCDERGLWGEAKTHWEAVVRLNPKDERARKRLGFRLRNRQWALDEASAEDAAQDRANAYWKKVLQKCHERMRCRSKVSVPGRAEAVAQVEAIEDPRAAASLWAVFAADPSHHGLMVGVLGHFKSRPASQMLAALAVYSPDDKARAAAIRGLQGREPADYADRLASLMHKPMRYEMRRSPISGGPELFVEGDTANYQFFFSRVNAPTQNVLPGCFQPRLTANERRMAQQFNEQQAALARAGLEQQLELAKSMIEKCNDSIRELNARVAHVLNDACGAGISPTPNDARRWLALALGDKYKPPVDGPKPTITEIVSPLYNPTFLPIPVAS